MSLVATEIIPVVPLSVYSGKLFHLAYKFGDEDTEMAPLSDLEIEEQKIMNEIWTEKKKEE
jgi:hypothetical protein